MSQHREPAPRDVAVALGKIVGTLFVWGLLVLCGWAVVIALLLWALT